MTLILDGVDLAAEPDLCGEQIQWVDEFEWSAIEQDQDRSLSGALIVQEGVKRYGRPVTLASNGGAWFPLSVVRQLEALRDQLSRPLLLELPSGVRHWVIFNRVNGSPLEAVQVLRRVAADAMPYSLTLRLITVPPPPAP